MELFDLYDMDRNRTGKTMVRGEDVPEGYCRLIVHICVFSPDGRMLIQKRQPFKDNWSGLWDLSVGGSATLGDDSRSAAERELREELGLEEDFSVLRPVLTIYWRDGFDDFYVLTRDLEPADLCLQPEEVETARWAGEAEILALIDRGEFIPYQKGLINLLFFLRNHRGSHTRPDWTERTVSGGPADN